MTLFPDLEVEGLDEKFRPTWYRFSFWKALRTAFRYSCRVRVAQPELFSAFRALVWTEYMGRERVRWEEGFSDAKTAEARARAVASRCDWLGVDPRGYPVSKEVGIKWAVVPAVVKAGVALPRW